MNDKDVSNIKELIHGYLADTISTDEFCKSFEDYVNFELDAGALEPNEIAAIKSLFGTVSWFSPFEEDRKSYKGFKSEEEIKVAAESSARELGLSSMMLELLSVVKLKESSRHFSKWGRFSGTIVDIKIGEEEPYQEEPYQIEFCDENGRAIGFVLARPPTRSGHHGCGRDAAKPTRAKIRCI